MEPQDVPEEIIAEPDTLQQEEAEILTTIGSQAISFLHAYGWYLVILGGAALYAWHAWLKEKYEAWRLEKEEREYDARYHKNPDIGGRVRDKIEEARKKQQDALNKASALHAEIQQEREMQKQQQKLAQHEPSVGGRKLGNALSEEAAEEAKRLSELAKKARAFKKDYNPLDGNGSHGGYRPPTKNCPGGGCGRR